MRNLMRTFVVAGALLIFGAGVAGCGAEPGPDTEPSTAAPAQTSPAEVATPSTPEPSFDVEGYLLNLSHDPFLDSYSDQDLIDLGLAACAAMPDADDLAPARDVVADTVKDPDSTSLIVWTAIPMICPEYESLVDIDLGGVATPAPAPTGAVGDSYLGTLRADPFFTDSTDDALLIMGRTICDGFTRGDTLEQTLGFMYLFPEESALLQIEASVRYICPQHSGMLG